ncbi:hypothetical protein TNCV_1249071 [Trichonephila clavipes]|nr:hypothetical protein TNCV_1249071 [Trichonephila clavipes]
MDFSSQRFIKGTLLLDSHPFFHPFAHVGRMLEGMSDCFEEDILRRVFPVRSVDRPSIWPTRCGDVVDISRDAFFCLEEPKELRPRQRMLGADPQRSPSRERGSQGV